MTEGVFITGMDRSGTSATTRLVCLFGLRPPLESDLIAARDTNPTGVWESRSLAALNVRLLQTVGSDERFPLCLAPGWELDPRLDALRPEARAAFARVFPDPPWAWKDPLHCLALSFWRSTLDCPAAVVLVIRNPLEIAASAQRAWGREKIFGLALWERYLRRALSEIAGLPVLVTDYADVVGDPVAWAAQTHEGLRRLGLAVQSYRAADIAGAVDRTLRHSEFAFDDLRADGEVSRAQCELYHLLMQLQGTHDAFDPPALPEETPTTGALLSERRRAFEIKDRLERELAAERGSRWQAKVRRLAGGGGTAA
jgi:hypothetical protein